MNYNKYLEFIANPRNGETVKDCHFLSHFDGEDFKDIPEGKFNTFLLYHFLEANSTGSFELNDGLLVDFPLNLQAEILQKFVDDPYFMGWGYPKFEVAKMIYHLWPRYMSWQDDPKEAGFIPQSTFDFKRKYPHDKIFNYLCKIKRGLEDFKGVNDAKTFFELIQSQKAKNSQTLNRFYNWHLFAFFPLLGSNGLDLMMNVSKLFYDNSQDMLMFGLARFRASAVLPILREIFSYWHNYKNINLGNSHDMREQIGEIANIYNKQGVNILRDPTIAKILEKEGMRFD